MKALIFNSGIGSRMDNLTLDKPKCLVELYNGETILERQVRILSKYGIKNFIITTGPHEDKIKNILKRFNTLNFTFVKNEKYENTNYIYSMYKSIPYLDDDILLLHGDLVFNNNLVKKILSSDNKSICLYNPKKELPKKDFKGRIIDNKLKEVSINIFDDNCYSFQPLYKLDKDTLNKWLNKVEEYIKNNNINVYAENALNEILDELNILPISYEDDYIEEIDNLEDYKKVTEEIKYYDYKEQEIIVTNNFLNELKKYISENDKIFIVCGIHIKDKINSILSSYDYYIFNEFTSNPKYEEIKKGLDIFKENNFNKIISIGGGSSIDVAKCIKLFYNLDNELDFLENKYHYNDITHIAIPTTAGTGSESTGIAVMYYQGEKKSIYHGSILPEVAILDYSLLSTLPHYDKKSTLLDALSQAIESFWSKNYTTESREYSKKCIELIMDNYKSYIDNNEKLEEILLASNFSGKAINISKTTAPHSMSYKLTTDYGISHGHAVALCLIPCWKKLLEYKDDEYVFNSLNELAKILNTDSIEESIKKVEDIIISFDLPKININDIKYLARNVNIERLSNNPIKFTLEELEEIYSNI